MATSQAAKRPLSPARGDLSPPPVRRKVESTTTSKAVSSFFKPASQREPEILRWRIVNNSLIVGKYGATGQTSDTLSTPPKSRKIAAFDLDDTLITAAAGSKWAKSATGWRWWHASIPAKLKQLHNDGYLVVILSNQGNISLKENAKALQKDTTSLANFKAQLTAILRQLDLPISVYAATESDKYRKPRTGMWQEMLEDYDVEGDGAVDLGQSFYVGDAAGRAKTVKRRKDHACSDRNLAANIGISFRTPEEYFLGEPAEPFDRDFDPKDFLRQTSVPTHAPYSKRNSQDIVMFCGSPGAGKSTYYWENLKPLGYERINQDILKSRDRCLKVAREQLSAGNSVAIDNTNADVVARAHWLRLGQDFRIPVRCVLFTATPRLCEHNDSVRALNPDLMNPEGRTMLPSVAFRSFQQSFGVLRSNAEFGASIGSPNSRPDVQSSCFTPCKALPHSQNLLTVCRDIGVTSSSGSTTRPLPKVRLRGILGVSEHAENMTRMIHLTQRVSLGLDLLRRVSTRFDH